jgi:hypothetical protein
MVAFPCVDVVAVRIRLFCVFQQALHPCLRVLAAVSMC